MMTPVPSFKTLDQITASDRPLVGGKAFNCALLKQAGLPVPDAVVIPAAAADADVRDLLDNEWMRGAAAGARFAVRSSGLQEDSEGHSFAGVHETRLNVEHRDAVEAVFACRGSSGSSQARAYREAIGLADEAQISVLVQQMVESQISGVAFTVNPVTGASELVINAAPGLGEDLASGRVEPDEVRVDKAGGRILSAQQGGERRASGRALMDDSLVRELAALLLRVEAHYGSPQDIEWCYDGTRLWILQSRPVTTAPAHAVPPAAQIPVPDNPDTEWTRANLVEVFPDQMSPQALAAYDVLLNRGQRQFMGRLLASDESLGPMFRIFHGRMYMNLSQMRRVVSIAGAPAADMLRSLGHSEAIRPDDEEPHRAPLSSILPCLPDLVRITITDARAAKILKAHEQRTRAEVARLSSVDVQHAPDAQIWAEIMRWLEDGPEAIQIVFVMSGVLFRETTLRRACASVGFPYERLVYPNLAAGTRSVSSQQAYDLVALADVARQDALVSRYLLDDAGSFADYRERLAGTPFLARFDAFLAQYGHRGRYESDWALPRLHENPAAALFAIRGHLNAAPQDAAAIAARQEADARAAWREFGARLTPWQRLTSLPRWRGMLRRLKNQYVWREQVRSDLTRVVDCVRRLHLALADRFVERGWLEHRDDYFLLTVDQIRPSIDDARRGPSLGAMVVQRRAEMARQASLQMPLLMTSAGLPQQLAAQGTAMQGTAVRATGTPGTGWPGDDTLTGLCVSPGLVEGEVVVLRDPREFAQMKRGAILVAPATDPSWTPLFTLAAGVVVEIGGMLSHASTIAREYGLPALANVRNATTLLKTGERVTLDASNGRVVRAGASAGSQSARSSEQHEH